MLKIRMFFHSDPSVIWISPRAAPARAIRTHPFPKIKNLFFLKSHIIMTSPPLVNPISFSSAQLITRSFGSSLPARVFAPPILFFLFFEKEKNRRAR